MRRSVALKAARDVEPGKPAERSRRIGDALAIVEGQGLLSGGRTLTVRGRMPSRLVELAKKKSGIQSDSKLIEAALANIVAEDDYGEWLLSRRGTVNRDLELEF